MKKIMLTIAASALMTASIHAQTYLEGNVTDSKTGEALPFVNIAVSGTSVGTISDLNGEFKLTVPENMIGRELMFSSVGFSSASYKIAQVQNQRVAVQLEPMDLKIEEVVVTDKSEAGRKLVKNALGNVQAKFVDCDYAFAGNYRNVYTGGGEVRTADYVFNAYDAAGYRRGESNNAFEAFNFKFVSTKRDFKVADYKQGLNYLAFVQGLDPVRYQLGVMNSATLRDFDFKIKSETADRYVIEFSCNKPSLLNTGACSPTKYSGTITIAKQDNVVVESEYQLQLRNINLDGLSIAEGSGNGAISCKITYEKFTSKYAMKSIQARIDVSGAADGDYQIADDVTVTSVNYKVPGKISGKVFFSR